MRLTCIVVSPSFLGRVTKGGDLGYVKVNSILTVNETDLGGFEESLGSQSEVALNSTVNAGADLWNMC